MDEQLSAPATATLYIAFSLSVIALAVAFYKQFKGNPLLPYEPRKRVPWGVLGTIVPVCCVIIQIVLVLEGGHSKQLSPNEFAINGLFTAVVMVGFVFIAIPWLKMTCGATLCDLGLAFKSHQLGRDIGIGIFAFFISLLPVYAIQFLVTAILQPEQEHQIIEQIIEHKSLQMLLVGAVMAVIAAPLFEEFTFRLLLQGWLERREDEILGIQETERIPPGMDEEFDKSISATNVDNEADEPLPDTVFTIETPEDTSTQAPGMLFGLPHGWAPVLISGFVFGLAHVGHGVAPIPLILFGIVLGYLYQRTHRLVPCITAHALFNAYSMGLLWLQINGE